MTVIGILVVLIGLAVPAVTSISKASQMNVSGRLVSSLLTNARSEAINRRRLVQLRVATSWSSDSSLSYRKLSLWVRPLSDDAVQAPVGTTDPFVQISPWETLPPGVMLEPTDPTKTTPPYPSDLANPPGTYFLDLTLGNVGTGLKIAGGITANYAWVQFDPNGAVNFAAASGTSQIYLILTEGVFPPGSSTISYTRANHPDWVQAQVTCLTGRVQIVRP